MNAPSMIVSNKGEKCYIMPYRQVSPIQCLHLQLAYLGRKISIITL